MPMLYFIICIKTIYWSFTFIGLRIERVNDLNQSKNWFYDFGNGCCNAERWTEWWASVGRSTSVDGGEPFEPVLWRNDASTDGREKTVRWLRCCWVGNKWLRLQRRLTHHVSIGMASKPYGCRVLYWHVITQLIWSLVVWIQQPRSPVHLSSTYSPISTE